MDRQRILFLVTQLSVSATDIATGIKYNDINQVTEALTNAERDLAEIRQIIERLPPDPAN